MERNSAWVWPSCPCRRWDRPPSDMVGAVKGRLLAGRSVLPDRRDGVSHRGLGVDIGGSQRAVARGAGWADRVLPPGLETRWIPGLVHTRTLRRGKTN